MTNQRNRVIIINRRMLILILLTILPLFVQAEEQRPTISDIDYIGLLGEKNNLEKKLEDYVNTVLDRMMGPEKASCVISITPEVEKSKISFKSIPSFLICEAVVSVSFTDIDDFLEIIPDVYAEIYSENNELSETFAEVLPELKYIAKETTVATNNTTVITRKFLVFINIILRFFIEPKV